MAIVICMSIENREKLKRLQISSEGVVFEARDVHC